MVAAATNPKEAAEHLRKIEGEEPPSTWAEYTQAVHADMQMKWLFEPCAHAWHQHHVGVWRS